jgi:hypothetical protein
MIFNGLPLASLLEVSAKALDGSIAVILFQLALSADAGRWGLGGVSEREVLIRRGSWPSLRWR